MLAATWAKALPLGRVGLRTQSAAWEGAWKRLFALRTPQLQQATRQSSALHTLRAQTRYSFTRPRATNTKWSAFQGSTKRGFRFSPWRRSQGGEKSAEENLSMGARLRKLFREYGKAAVAVYFTLSILDFPFFFLLVRVVGTERIAKLEHWVVSNIVSFVPESVRKTIRSYWDAFRNNGPKEEQIGEAADTLKWNVQNAEERHREEASLATQLALAYAVHKSFIFIRIPVTAAITPKVVKQLRAWGWNIGKPIRRSP